MVQIKVLLLPLVAAVIGGCASVPTHTPSALELTASAPRISASATSCKGAQRTSVCNGGTCRCTDSNALLQTLGIDDAVWQGQ